DLLLPLHPAAAEEAARSGSAAEGNRQGRRRRDHGRAARPRRRNDRRRAHLGDRRVEGRPRPREGQPRKYRQRAEGQEGRERRRTMNAPRRQRGGAAALVVFFAYRALAALVPKETRRARPLLPDQGLRLGLDLQGGIHWVRGVKLAEAEKQELE